jgi:uncharacterized OB-fold protein
LGPGMFPEPTPETAEFWAGAEKGELRLPHCRTCDRYYFYPRPFCRYCASYDVDWRVVPGRGRLVSYVINYRPVEPIEGADARVVALVELDEGPRMMTNIVGVDPDPDKLPLDAPVQVAFESRGGKTIPVFRLAASS